MATSVTYLDDLTGEPAEFVDFHLALDGKDYNIDLSANSHARLIEALAPFTTAARRLRSVPTQRRSTTPMPQRRTPPGRKEQLQAIRDWANKQGMPVADRGRIPAGIEKAFEAAHSSNGHEPPQSVQAQPLQKTSGIAAIRARVAEERGVPEETLMSAPEEEDPEEAAVELPERPTFDTEADFTRAVRIWALGKGFNIAPKGRVPQAIIQKWKRDHGEPVVLG